MIRVKGLVKYYGDHCAARAVDLEVEAGQVVGFLGLNGAGKTTILRMLAGDLEPSAGFIEVGGRNLQLDPIGYRRRVGFLPETVPVYPELTVTEYLSYVAALRGVPASEVTTRVDDVCVRVALGPVREQLIEQLSHGYRKRLGIASSIVHGPDLVILDEAISGLDPKQIVDMRSLIRDLAGQHTVLVSSHILTEISQTCDHIFVIRDGEIVAEGSEEEIRGRYTGVPQIMLVLRGSESVARKACEAVVGVKEVTSHGSDGEGLLSLGVRAEQDVREALVKSCVGAGLGVLRVDLAESELEAAFLELTGSSSAAGAAGAADPDPGPGPGPDSDSDSDSDSGSTTEADGGGENG